MAPRQRDMPGDPDAKEIVKVIDILTVYGHNGWRIFEDWLAYCEATLRCLPMHAISILETGKPAEDNDADKALFAELNARYSNSLITAKWHEVFARALQMMMDVAERGDIKDILGDIYMNYGFPSESDGQFFTPFNVALMMARMTDGGDIMAEVKKRVLAAVEQTPFGQAMMLAGIGVPEDVAAQYLTTALLPELMPYIEPITVSDPSCGSGVMFLALTSVLPRWVTQFGIVQFYGADIDETCVKMAKVNVMLYGLNGWGAKWMAAQTLLAAKLREKMSATEAARSSANSASTIALQPDNDDSELLAQATAQVGSWASLEAQGDVAATTSSIVLKTPVQTQIDGSTGDSDDAGASSDFAIVDGQLVAMFAVEVATQAARKAMVRQWM